MARPIEDDGHLLRFAKPIRLVFYAPDRLPDAVQMAGCLIGVNDSRDGVPRQRLAMSNGASWDYFARVDELAQPSQAVAVAQQYDIAPMVHAAVREMLPSLQTPVRPAIAHMPSEPMAELQDGLKHCAISVIELLDHVNTVRVENADLRANLEGAMARLDYIERVALAKVEAA